MSINCVFLPLLRNSSKSTHFIFIHILLRLIVKSYRKFRKLLAVKKDINKNFLSISIEISEIRFLLLSQNKALSPTLNFAFSNLYK